MAVRKVSQTRGAGSEQQAQGICAWLQTTSRIWQGVKLSEASDVLIGLLQRHREEESPESCLWATTLYVRGTRMDLGASHLIDKRCSNVNYAVSTTPV